MTDLVLADPVIATSPHAEAAKALLDKIRALRTEVPRLIPEIPEESKKLVPKAAVPDPFIESASVSIQAFARLETAADSDAATLRDAFAYAIAYDAVVQELFSFGRTMAHSIRVQRAKAGASALDIYAIARRYSKQKSGAELIPHVEDMRRKLKRGRRKTTSQPVPDPAAPEGADKQRV
jgi:hypothetical protein